MAITMSTTICACLFACAVLGASGTDVSAVAALGRVRPIGAAISQGVANETEQVLFEYSVTSADDWAVMTHFWTAGDSGVDYVNFKYYIDGESTPSIAFQPPLACGVGFDDQTAPWGTKWFGKGAHTTGWFHNFRIPFKSIKITYATDKGAKPARIWMIVRGSDNLPLRIGGVDLPSTARMKLYNTNVELAPLQFVDLAKVSGAGMLFLTTMQVESGNQNFMEGCMHLYTQDYTQWPGLLLSTGMEDYFDSAFYFNGGTFHAPVAGSTHLAGGNFSGYRFHEMDPIVFSDGMRFQWRNGDVTDPATGLKCTLESGGTPSGSPQTSQLRALVWVYQW